VGQDHLFARQGDLDIGARQRHPGSLGFTPGRLERQHLLQVAAGGADEEDSHGSQLYLDFATVRARLLRNRSSRATFLCYHSIAPEGPRHLTISAELFERQLAALGRRGLRSGDLGALAAAAAGDRLDPTVFLTFDDGFRDNYETALPLLRAAGFGAFVFVLPPLVDGGGQLAWPEVADAPRRWPATMRSATWSMLEEMKEAGVEVGSHGLTHAHLPELGAEALREELWESRARIRERLGSCDTLAYPFGERNAAVEQAARECGYRFGFSLPTKGGQRRAAPSSIPRINVDYRDGGRRFAAKLSSPGKRVLLSPEVAALRRTVRALRRS
jgi:peptidoglycan/xylan/chitin deacetylase (PgdA/CDA1 family)